MGKKKDTKEILGEIERNKTPFKSIKVKKSAEHNIDLHVYHDKLLWIVTYSLSFNG